MDKGACQGTVHGVTKSWTWLSDYHSLIVGMVRKTKKEESKCGSHLRHNWHWKIRKQFFLIFCGGQVQAAGEGCGLKPSISLHISSPVGEELWALWIFWKHLPWPSLVAQMVKNPHVMQETWVRSLGWEDPLEEEMATHSSILAWRIPWTGQPGRLQFMGSQSVWHNRATNTFTS